MTLRRTPIRARRATPRRPGEALTDLAHHLEHLRPQPKDGTA